MNTPYERLMGGLAEMPQFVLDGAALAWINENQVLLLVLMDWGVRKGVLVRDGKGIRGVGKPVPGIGGKSGRPSKVKWILETDLNGFFDGCLEIGEGQNRIVARLQGWLAAQKILFGRGTARRCITELVAAGKLRKTEAGLYLRGPKSETSDSCPKTPPVAIGTNATGANAAVPANTADAGHTNYEREGK